MASASRVSRVLMTGPLASFADVYRSRLLERGYTPLTTVNELRQVGRLSGWLQARGLSVAELSGERVEEFLAWQRAEGRHRAGWSRPGLACLLEVLRGNGVLAPERPAPAGSPAELLLASFERYLLAERGLAAGTAAGYAAHVRWFLDGRAPGRELAGLTAGEVTGAVLGKAASGVSVSAAQYFVSGLRSFLRFSYLCRRRHNHDLRHTFGTRMAAQGIPMRALQEMMGHRDFKTTLIYADYTPSAHEAEWVEAAFAPAAALEAQSRTTS